MIHVNRLELALKVKQFIKAPYFLGDAKKGWDCLSLLNEFSRFMGKDLPPEYRGINWGNYAEKWESGEAKKIFKEFLLSLGSSISPNYALEGDIFVFEGPESAMPGIYLGGGNLLTVFKQGVKVLPLKQARQLFSLIDVRRL